MPSEAVGILLVADDRALLQVMSRFLQAFGYRVSEAASREAALASLSCFQPDVLIVDEAFDSNSAPRFLQECRSTWGGRCAKLLLTEGGSRERLVAALKADADDFLHKPLVYGEILARLRAVCRWSEHQRRAAEQLGVDPLTRLPNNPSWVRDASALLAESRAHACILFDVDLLANVNGRFGHGAGNAVIRATADLLREQCPSNGLPACFGGGRFVVLLPAESETDAREWADQTRRRLGEQRIAWESDGLQITASCGLAAPAGEKLSAAALLARARQALEAAKRSGRDCLVTFAEFQEEERHWRELAGGDLLASTTARDVMAPLAATLSPEDIVERARRLFSAARLTEAAVVDQQGRLRGLLHADDLHGAPDDESVSPFVRTDAPTVAQRASLAEVMDRLIQLPEALAVVMENERPIGVVHSASLGALGEPLTAATLREGADPSFNSEYLITPEPDLVGKTR